MGQPMNDGGMSGGNMSGGGMMGEGDGGSGGMGGGMGGGGMGGGMGGGGTGGVESSADGGTGSGGGGAVDAGTPAGPQVGDACASRDLCPSGGSGSTVCRADWPGGYCAVDGCSQHGHDCPSDPGLGGTATVGSKCVLAPTAFCLSLCGSDADCRAGYACVDKSDAAGHGSAKVCVPQ